MCVADWAGEVVDEVATRDVAVPYAFRVIGRMLGTPRADDARLARLAQGVVGAEDPLRQMAEVPSDALRIAMIGLRDYFEAVAADRRAQPGDDLASLIVNATPHGAPMPHYELISFFILMVTAGHDTAALALSGGLEALLAHPDQLTRLSEQPELLDGAIEEILRWTTPVRHFMRTALCDMDINGQSILSGEALAPLFHSGNRDETVFEQADRFMIDRKSNPHIAFGRGPHICMGLHLARMEMRALLSELLRRTEQIVPAGRPRRIRSAFMGGVGSLPIRLVFRAARG